MTQEQQPEALRLARELRGRAQFIRPEADTLCMAAAGMLERLHGSLEAQRLISDRAIALGKELESQLALAQQVAPQQPWKDHLTARLVNDLRDCAQQYHDTGQLRERIAYIVAPLCDALKVAQQESHAAPLEHIYQGNCPDALSSPAARDPDCPACRAMRAYCNTGGEI